MTRRNRRVEVFYDNMRIISRVAIIFVINTLQKGNGVVGKEEM
jgi:hypothetical protein